MEYTLTSALAGLTILTVINGFKLECTSFTLVMALLNVLVSFGYTFCTFRALGSINLSLYSVFSMLGGMAPPFLQGILIYDESLTVGKIVCVAMIISSLLCFFGPKKPSRRELLSVLIGFAGMLALFLIQG